jgi:hypothetical protein
MALLAGMAPAIFFMWLIRPYKNKQKSPNNETKGERLFLFFDVYSEL